MHPVNTASGNFWEQSTDFRVPGRGVPLDFTRRYNAGTVIRIPIAHAEGNYFADKETLDRLEGDGLVAFRYCTPNGELTVRQAQ